MNEELKENTIKIDVNLNELQKLYPNVDHKNENFMKILGEQLIDGIKLDDAGNVMVDQSKLNPLCLEIVEKNLNLD